MAFTLVELLVVITIILVLLAFTLPAVNSVVGGSELTQAAQAVGDHFSLARQMALSKNRAIEVRFYQFGDPEIPGEQAAVPTSGKYRALQSFEMQDSGAAVALGKINRLPTSIIIDSGATLSSLLDPAANPSMKKVWTPPSDPQVSLPRVGTNYNCYAFRFLPDGSTSLKSAASNVWFLTMHKLNDGDSLSTPPKNFFTLQIDATSGHSRPFRP